MSKNTLVIYCRVSTAEQVENYSLETQERICREWAARHGYEVAKVFVEEGESAKTTKRPKFQEAIRYCVNNKKRVGVFLVYKLNRFARNNFDQMTTDTLLYKHDITLRSATEYFDDSAGGKMMKGMTGVFNQFDNDLRGENTLNAMKAAIADGKFTWRAPAGYLNVLDASGESTLTHDPHRAEIIREAFEQYATGSYTQNQVLTSAHQKGLRSRSGKPIALQTFTMWLRNPIYAGWVYARKWKETYKGNFPPIVPQEVFDRVQQVLSGKRPAVTPYKRNNPDFPLRVFLKCESCGASITGAWSSGRSAKYPYYRCPKGCTTVRREQTESQFISLLERLQLDSVYLQLFRRIVTDTWRRQQGDSAEKVRRSQTQITVLRDKKNKLLDAMLDGRVKQADYEKANDSLDFQIAEQESCIAEATTEELDLEAVVAFAERVLTNPSGLWSRAALANKQRLQKLYFPAGLTLTSAKTLGTVAAASVFSELAELAAQESMMASPAGFEPALPP